jgi:hypothetical protein
VQEFANWVEFVENKFKWDIEDTNPSFGEGVSVPDPFNAELLEVSPEDMTKPVTDIKATLLAKEEVSSRS